MVAETFDMAWLDLLFSLSCFPLVVPPHDPSQRRELDRTNPSNSSNTKATTNNAFTPLRSCMLLLVCFGLGVVKNILQNYCGVATAETQMSTMRQQQQQQQQPCMRPAPEIKIKNAVCVCVCVMCFVCVRVCKRGACTWNALQARRDLIRRWPSILMARGLTGLT